METRRESENWKACGHFRAAACPCDATPPETSRDLLGRPHRPDDYIGRHRKD